MELQLLGDQRRLVASEPSHEASFHDLSLDLLTKEMTLYQRTRDLKMCNFVGMFLVRETFSQPKNIGRASRTTKFPIVFCSEKVNLNFIIPMKRFFVKMILVQPPATAVFVENHGFANLNVLQEGFPQPRRTGEAPARSPERQI